MRERRLCISIFFSHCNFESVHGIIYFSPSIKTVVSWRNGQDKKCHHTFRNGGQGALCTHFLSGNLGFLPFVLCAFFHLFVCVVRVGGRVVAMLGLQAHRNYWKAGLPCSEAAHPWRFCCAPCLQWGDPALFWYQIILPLYLILATNWPSHCSYPDPLLLVSLREKSVLQSINILKIQLCNKLVWSILYLTMFSSLNIVKYGKTLCDCSFFCWLTLYK